jgi:ubiquinone/menaquinone biosynthesis C-methylase UbiE
MSNHQSWEETIRMIQSDPEHTNLVRDAYLSNDLKDNALRFESSIEFAESLKLVKKYAPTGKTLLDIGAGNGISSVAFAKNKFDVIALDPDPSEIVGTGAIKKLVEEFNLQNLQILESSAEKIDLPNSFVDIVYVRQAMHHAANLNQFIAECSRILKPGGMLLTTRDHVIYDAIDKQKFLDTHPLHRFYGGENAFTIEEYTSAMSLAGLKIKEQLGHFDSPINYFPSTSKEIGELPNLVRENRKKALFKKIGHFSSLPGLIWLYNLYLDKKIGKALDEKRIAGRLYTFAAIKV